MPLVSVLTPVYNGEEFLEQCLESVVRQTYADWEYVVVDNRSTDRTPEILASYAAREPRIRVVSPPDFVEQVPNFNRTLREMDPAARWCKLLCADDWLFPECLERMVRAGEANPQVGMVGAYRLDGTTVNLDGLRVEQEVFSGPELCRRCLLGGPYVTGSPSSTMIRADLVRERHDFYDESVWLFSDTDACYRVFAEHDVAWVHQVLTYTRRHEATMTTKAHGVRSYAIDNLRALVRYGPRVMPRDEYRRAVRAELGRYAWVMAKQEVRGRTRRDDLRSFHLEGLRALEDEANGDREVRLVSRACRRVLQLHG